MVSVPLPEVIVLPLTDVGVIAPKVKVMAGVVVAVATVPDTPLAVVTLTDVTVPLLEIELQPKPELVVQVNAEDAVLQLGMASAVGDAGEAVPLPTIVFAVILLCPLRGNPVALVSVPELGVPNAPPFTIGEPALPTLTASAVATPVPRPLIPVDTGSPVAELSPIAPTLNVIAGAVVGFATLPDIPFAVTTLTVVTVPLPPPPPC
jgi:hypothetical protein